MTQHSSVLWLFILLALTPVGAQAAPPDRPSVKAAAGSDWPGFLGPHSNSKSDEVGVLGKWPATGPRIVWQRPLGASYGMPIVVQGKLLMFDRHQDRARLTCMSATTGEEFWKFEYPTMYEDLLGYNNGPRCSPVADGDRVYIFGAEGMLHCLRIADGAVVWKLDTAEKFHVAQNFFGVGSTPVVEGNLLIAQIGGSPPQQRDSPPGRLDLVKGNKSGIVAFDKLTGEVKYSITDELASYSSPVLATLGARRWCFVFARGGLVGFDPRTGKVDFHFPWRAKMLESVNASNPVVVGDQVFISETYGPGSALLRVRPGGYEVVWKDSPREQAMQTHWNTAIHVDGFLYGASGRHTGNAELRCVELATGKVAWSEPDLSRASLLYVDRHFVCLTEYGELLLLRVNPKKFDLVSRSKPVDPATGRPLLQYPAWAAPILSHGLLYVRGDDRLLCLEAFTAAR